MTYKMEYAAYLFACGARGEQPEPPKKQVNWEDVLQISAEQCVIYTVAVPLIKNDLGCPANLKKHLKISMGQSTVKNLWRTEQ